MTEPVRRVKSPTISVNTHQTRHYRKAFADMIREWDFTTGKRPVLIDPFARNCHHQGFDSYTNDINPRTKANYHLDALDFLDQLPSNSADFAIFDPPFSQERSKRSYGETSNVYTVPSYVKDCFAHIARILKPGGKIMKLGFNSNRNHPSLKLLSVLIASHGGNHNDTIVTIWQRVDGSLFDYMEEE